MKTPTNIFYTVLAAFALFGFACFVLAPQARGACQDACLTNNNTVQGDDALVSLTTGTDNTSFGFNALLNNTTGAGNTAVGSLALYSNTTAGENVSNVTGNTAVGYATLFSTTTGERNTAVGAAALNNNTTGDRNTATGRAALVNNTTGAQNTADGHDALFNNTTGTFNTATGSFALFGNVTGNHNTAVGRLALSSNTDDSNTAMGYDALIFKTSGAGNTALGNGAGFNLTSGNFNILLGNSAGVNLTTGDNSIDIGNAGVAGESNTIRIGTQGTQTRTFVAGINATAVSGSAVKINANGQLGVPPSSARFKNEIKPMDKASEAVLALKPVTFRYKKEVDPTGIPQFGLVAEEVEKVNPDLVDRDADGKVYTVRYDAVNAMLLNEFLKEHHKVEEEGARLAKQDAIIAQQQKQIDALTAGLQKVTARVEAANSVPRIVSDN